MSNQKRTLADRIREITEMIGKLLNPSAPLPQPIPVRENNKRAPRR
jgi:hypothetical protein